MEPKAKTEPPGLGFGQRNVGGLYIRYRGPGWGSVSADEGGGGGHWANMQGEGWVGSPDYPLSLFFFPPFSHSLTPSVSSPQSPLVGLYPWVVVVVDGGGCGRRGGGSART